MHDLHHLRPRNDSLPELRAAHSRVVDAIARCGEELQAATSQHGMALVVGTPAALAAAEKLVERLKGRGLTLLAMHQELERRLSIAAPAPTPASAAEITAHALAVHACQEMITWWAQHGDAMQHGLRLMGAAASALIDWQGAQGAGRPAPAVSNVVPLVTPPGAA